MSYKFPPIYLELQTGKNSFAKFEVWIVSWNKILPVWKSFKCSFVQEELFGCKILPMWALKNSPFIGDYFRDYRRYEESKMSHKNLQITSHDIRHAHYWKRIFCFGFAKIAKAFLMDIGHELITKPCSFPKILNLWFLAKMTSTFWQKRKKKILRKNTRYCYRRLAMLANAVNSRLLACKSTSFLCANIHLKETG